MTKSEARDQAQTTCGSSGIIITPPNIDADVVNGYLAIFYVEDLDLIKKRFSVSEISENVFTWVSGLDCFQTSETTDVEKLVAILKIWGIYRGGYTQPSIQEKHNLDEEGYLKLANKEWYGLTITLEDDGTITWTFPAN